MVAIRCKICGKIGYSAYKDASCECGFHPPKKIKIPVHKSWLKYSDVRESLSRLMQAFGGEV